MGFSGTFEGILRGKKHYFQMEWIDVHQGFEFVDGGYNVTVIEGGKPYIVWITQDQIVTLPLLGPLITRDFRVLG